MVKIKEIIKKIIMAIISFFKKLFNKIKVVVLIIAGKIITITKKGISITARKENRGQKESIDELLNKVDKKIKNIEKNYLNETSNSILKTYIKQLNKIAVKLNNTNLQKTREEEKEIKKKVSYIKTLIVKIEKYQNELVSNEEKTSVKDSSKKVVKNIGTSSKKAVKNIGAATTNIKNSKAVTGAKAGAKVTVKFVSKSLVSLGTKIVLVTGALIASTKKTIKVKKQKIADKKILVDNLKYLNRKINTSYDKISKIKNSNSATKLEELLFLKEKIIDLKDNYVKLSKIKGFNDLEKDKRINNIDPNHLVHHDKAVSDLINYLEKSIEEVKEEKNNKREINEERIDEPVKKEFVVDTNQLALIKNSIKKDVENSTKDIERVRREIEDIPFKYKKETLLSRISNFFKFSIKAAISLIPFGVFKNKFYATLTSGIILNTKIRSMQSMMKNTNVPFINYDALLNSITDRATCLSNINYVLYDTITRIDALNSDLLENYNDNVEALSLVKNLEEMKIDLLEENTKVNEMLEEAKELKKKIKTKN